MHPTAVLPSALTRDSMCRGQSERGGMDTTTQAAGESIVGNEGVDADAMSTASTGFASFKETGARLPVLAEEGSKGTEASRSWTQELKMLGV